MARKLLSKDIELSPQQQQALSLLLAGTSVTATAEEVGVARQTVSGWRHHDPQFRAAFNAGMLSLKDSQQQVLMDAHMRAMARLIELMGDTDKNVSLKAAMQILRTRTDYEFDKRTTPDKFNLFW